MPTTSIGAARWPLAVGAARLLRRLVDGHARVALGGDRLDHAPERHLVRQREHLVRRRHHLADGGVAELEHVVDEPPLGHLQLALLRADVDERAKLLFAQPLLARHRPRADDGQHRAGDRLQHQRAAA